MPVYVVGTSGHDWFYRKNRNLLPQSLGVRCRHVSAATFYRCVAAGGMKNLLSFTFRSTALKKGGVDGHEVSNELLMGFKGYKFVGGELNT